MATLATLRDRIRGMCGDPDDTEMPDATIEGILAAQALDWLNKRRPGKNIGSFSTVEDQQDYSVRTALVAAGYTVYRIVEVWWLDSDFEWFSPSMRYLPHEQDLNFQLAGISVLENPAIVEAFHRQLENYKVNFKGTGEETENGQVRLMPAPGNSGDAVYFEYSYPRWAGPANVPDQWIQGYQCKATELVLRRLAVKRGRVRSTRHGTGGGGENEKAEAERNLEEAESEIPIAGAFFARA